MSYAVASTAGVSRQDVRRTGKRREDMRDSERKDGKARKRQAPSEAKRLRDKQHLDEKLDEALEETFPASDPFEITPERE